MLIAGADTKRLQQEDYDYLWTQQFGERYHRIRVQSLSQSGWLRGEPGKGNKGTNYTAKLCHASQSHAEGLPRVCWSIPVRLSQDGDLRQVQGLMAAVAKHAAASSHSEVLFDCVDQKQPDIAAYLIKCGYNPDIWKQVCPTRFHYPHLTLGLQHNNEVCKPPNVCSIKVNPLHTVRKVWPNRWRVCFTDLSSRPCLPRNTCQAVWLYTASKLHRQNTPHEGKYCCKVWGRVPMPCASIYRPTMVRKSTVHVQKVSCKEQFQHACSPSGTSASGRNCKCGYFALCNPRTQISFLISAERWWWFRGVSSSRISTDGQFCRTLMSSSGCTAAHSANGVVSSPSYTTSTKSLAH